jgi:biopolymer transport protein ExbB
LLVAVAAVSCPDFAWAQTSPAPAEAAPTQPEAAPQGFLTFVGGWVGLLIITLLLALSLTAAYLVFEHLMTIRRTEIMPEGLGDNVRQSLLRGDAAGADRVCRAHPSVLSFVLLSGLAEIEGGWPAIEKALEDAIAEQSARLLRKIEYLSVIGNIAPMVGLLGTVTGMIFAFQRVSATQGSAGAADLAEGIYQALVTTVGGLIVAIPSLGAFAILRSRVDQLIAEAAYLAQHVFTPLKRRRPAARKSQPPPSPPVQRAP